jgi:hypothetical protein
MQPHASPHPPLDGESDAAILAARGAQGGAGNQPPPSGIAHEGGQVRGLIGDITALHGKRQISAGRSLTCAPGDVRQPADGSPLWLLRRQCDHVEPSKRAPAIGAIQPRRGGRRRRPA